MILLQHALEGEDHGIGIEGRAVLKGHVIAQIEGVERAVVRDRPVGRQRRLHFERALLEAHQSVIEIDHDPEIVARRDRLRVEGFRLRDLPDEKHAGRRLCAGCA